MNKPIAAAAFLFLAACTTFAATLTPDEARLVSTLDMDAKIAAQLKDEGTTIERLAGPDGIAADGIVISAEPGTGDVALDAVRLQLHGTPFRAYLHDRAYGYGPDRIAIVRTDDVGYLDIVRTDGANHDVTHRQVVERYKAWNAKSGLVLVGAGPDWLEAKLRTPPNDWNAFAEEVAKFCPDVVEQGTGSVEGLAKEMAESGSVYLWWD